MPNLTRFLKVDRQDNVVLNDLKEFNQLFQNLYKQNLEEQITENHSPGVKPPKKARSDKLHRWMKLWFPFDARLVLESVTDKKGQQIKDPKARANELSKHWSPIFAEKRINGALAKCICEELQPFSRH